MMNLRPPALFMYLSQESSEMSSGSAANTARVNMAAKFLADLVQHSLSSHWDTFIASHSFAWGQFQGSLMSIWKKGMLLLIKQLFIIMYLLYV